MARVPTLLSSGNVKTREVASSRVSATPPVSHISTAVFDGPGAAPQVSYAGPESTAAAGRSISAGLQDLAGALNHMSQVNVQKAKERQAYDNHIWSESQFTTAQRDWAKWTSDVQQVGSVNVAARFTKEFQDYQNNMLKTAPNEDAAMRLKLRMDDLGTHVFDSALKIEAHNRVNNSINTFTQMLSDTSDVVVQDPFTAGKPIADLYKNVELARQQNRIPEDIYLKLKEQVNNLSAVQAEAAAPKDPEFARTVIESAQGIDWPRRRAVLNVIERAESTNSSLFQYEQQQALKSHLESLSQTGQGISDFDPHVYAAAYPKEHREAALAEANDKIEIAKSIYSVTTEIKGKSPGEIGQTLEKYRPQTGDPKFEAKQEVFHKATEFADQQVKLFHRDPFTYSRQDPVVDRAWDLVEQLPRNAKPDLVHQLTQQALEASTSYQKKLGVPEGALSAMSQASAAAYAQRINVGDTKQVQEAFGQLQATYGQYYPTAFRDMVRLPEGQRIDAATQIVALHQGQPFLTNFLAAVRTPESDMKLETKDMQQLRDKLITDPGFMAFKASMLSANPGATSMVDDYHHAVEKYAQSIYFSGKAKNPSDAVRQATDMVINSAYGFTTVSGTPVAVKRIQGTSRFNDSDISTIGFALKQFQGTVPVDRVDQSKFVFPQNISPEARSKSIDRTLKSDSFWVTNPQNDGATLYMNGAEGTTAPVRWKDGRTIEAKFSEALNYGNGLKRREKETSRPWWQPPLITPIGL